MLKHTYLGTSVAIVLVLVVVAGIAQIISIKNSASPSNIKGNSAKSSVQGLEKRTDSDFQEKEAPFEMKVKTVSGAIYTTKDIPLDIMFHNNAKEPVKLLDAFNNPAEKRVFFSVTLRDTNESPLFNVGGGKINIGRNSLKYIEIREDEDTTVRINLMDYDLPQETLKPGVYSVVVTYRNQYGENCFRGTLESEPIDLVLVR